MNQKKKDILPKLLEEPALMINCTIKHKLKESLNDDAIWCTGFVLGIEKYSDKSNMKHLFQVRYEDNIDEILFSSPRGYAKE